MKDGAPLQAVSPGEKVKIALRPENIAIGKQDGGNSFTARVTDRRYQGTQTVYDLDLFGRKLEALTNSTTSSTETVAKHGRQEQGLPRD